MNKKGVKNYLSITYSEDRRPKTDYPNKLASYLNDKYNLKRYKTLVDFGCGRGDMLEAFSKIKLDVSGIDNSDEISKLNDKFKTYQISAENENINIGNKFDIIFSKSLIEHLRNPLQFLINCKKLLNENGLVIILTPSWYHHNFGPFYLDSTHVTPFTIHSLKDIGLYAGFKNVEVDYFYQLPFVWKYKFLKIIPKTISALSIPYFPMYDKLFPKIWPNEVNKIIRFSREVMLISIMKL
tara:strand:+ start:352 stop:1068 length:717 start_codon:yes stop_codon:yes gene_type:complete